jgi:hypothetical protein
VKAFRNYITEFGEEAEIMSILGISEKEALANFRKKLVAFEKKRHYNNRLIVELLNNREFKDIFIFFL